MRVQAVSRRWHWVGLFVAAQAAAVLMVAGAMGGASALEDTDGNVSSGTAAPNELFTVSVRLASVDDSPPDRNFDAFNITLSWPVALAKVERPEDTFQVGAPFKEEFPNNPTYEIDEGAGTIHV